MLSSVTSLAISGTSLVVCLLALVLGSRCERLGGLYYLGPFALSLGFGLFVTQNMMVWRFLLCDLLCLIGFLSLCWKAPHPWPLWATGLQLLAVVTDIQVLVMSPWTWRWTIITLQNTLGYLILLCLLIGTLAAMRRRKAERQVTQE